MLPCRSDCWTEVRMEWTMQMVFIKNIHCVTEKIAKNGPQAEFVDFLRMHIYIKNVLYKTSINPDYNNAGLLVLLR